MTPPRPRPLLILKTGDTVAAARARRGDFEDWFRAGLGLPPAAVAVADPRCQSLPSPEALSGVVVTGSSAMVTDGHPWSEASAAWLRRALALGLPVLGVCYGHQLLAQALGGQVGDLPRGWEVGTVRVALTAAAARDPLFAGLPPLLPVHATHRQGVLRAPPGARILAGNADDACQAFAWGRRAWGVQFHPEFDVEILALYLRERAGELRAAGLDPEALAAGLVPTPAAAALLPRFAALCQSPARR